MSALSTGDRRTSVRAPASSRLTARLTTALFAAAAFFGAGMLFLVEPLIARLLLPSYGGSATVWSTSSLFFQAMLLLGYVYTDRTVRLGPRRQRLVHLAVLAVPLLALPLALPADAAPGAEVSPVLWLLRTLALVVGVPFLVLATTGPLLQKWYSWRGLERSADPYFLFAASNLGSFMGLLGYPFLIEPLLSLHQQVRLWSLGFVVFIILTAACLLLPAPPRGGAPPATDPEPDASVTGRPSVSRLLRWAALAFLPSGLMLAVTSHISTDIAAIPLLWVLPLAIYLATFVLAFARTSRRPLVPISRVAVLMATIASFSALVNVAHQPILVAITIQVVMLALVAFSAHARLAADRPAPAHLTTFYLVVAVGGALGGLLNGVIAPLVFDRVLEYPMLIVTVPLLLVGLDRRAHAAAPRRSSVRLLIAAVVMLTVAAGIAAAAHDARASSLGLALVGCALMAWALTRSPVLLCAVLVATQVAFLISSDAGVIERRRTFYGSLSVTSIAGQHRLYDGTTLHGTQFLDSRSTEPTSYYARSGPLGDVFASRTFRRIAVVGLGAGTLAAYGEPGQSMTFYEINPAVVSVARDPRVFTYLADSQASVRVVTGDGRLGLQAAPPGSDDLVILDAFSSDSIPVHLLTEEAVRIYAARLAPDGLLAFHISNNTFDLAPVLRADANALGWTAVVGAGGGDAAGGTPSTWVVLAPNEQALHGLDKRPGWTTLPARSVSWTDDYSSVLRVLR